MNIGQILETHLGWAASTGGYKVQTPVFDGASIEEIKAALDSEGLPGSGKTTPHRRSDRRAPSTRK